MIIQSVELVTPANAMSFTNKVYHARFDNGEEVDLFQQFENVYLPPESLVGLTLEAAKHKHSSRMTVAAYGASRYLSLVPDEYLAC